jgi:putative ABC transport system permease protein
VPLLAGRYFSRDSRFNREIILNENAVKVYGFESPQNAISQKMIFDGFDGQSIEIIGVIRDYHQKSLRSSLQPVIFNPVYATDVNLARYFSIRIAGSGIRQTMSQIRDTWNEFYPDQPFEYNFLDEIFNAQYKSDMQFGRVFGLFTFLAILISCLGLFALASYTNVQRTKEIGIRQVVGASTKNIFVMLVKDFIKWVVLANLIAWPVAGYAMNRWLQNFAYRIAISWWIFALAGGLTLVIALLTVSRQAIRAATANPVEALRYE